MPRLDGGVHVRLTVSDVDRSADWYGRVFGLVAVGGDERGALLLHPQSFATLVLAPADGPADRFDERRVGLHHLAFHVPAKDDLVDFARHLDALDIAHTGVRTSRYEPGYQIWLRDPDHVWLELYWVDRDQFIEGLRRSFRARAGVFASRGRVSAPRAAPRRSPRGADGAGSRSR